MASTDAVAFFGDTLVALLQSGLSGLVPPANISLSTPSEFKDSPPRPPAVTVFLYHIRIHGEMRNTSRRPVAGGALQPPPLPLELRFLITPWTQLTRDAYRIVGAIAQLLNDRAILRFGDLLGTGVWSPDDTVELVLESLPVEEHYDIWDPSDLPYRLSLTYLARLIGIDSAVTISTTPVTVVNLQKVGP